MFINSDRESISALRNNEKVKSLPFYHNQDEYLRMEIVYESNKVIKEMNISDTTEIYNSTPFVFVSGLPVDSIFRDKNVTVEKIGTYDNNWRKVGHKRYNKDLTREVAIIRSKEEN